MTEYLTPSFFTGELPKLAAAFARETGESKVYTELLLRDGVALRTDGDLNCTDTYVAFDHKSGGHQHRIVLPYSSIVGVGFSTEGEKAGIRGFK